MPSTSRMIANLMFFLALSWVVGAASALVSSSCAATPAVSNTTTTCQAEDTCCKDTYSHTGYGCCVLPGAVCCGNRGQRGPTCCPKGSECSPQGCTPMKHVYACGPVQGQNCTSSYICTPGPLPWTPTPGVRNVVVIGDSVSIGWTPQLASLLRNRSYYVTHSPASGDGGARSTSDMLQCLKYRLSTSDLKPLPLTKDDVVVFNFGLHDYNLGLAGADEYESELKQIVAKLQTLECRLIFVHTTPAHNTGNPMDNPTVIELNKRAASVMKAAGIPAVDLYTSLIQRCGPVPWADNGTNACSLCAPHCKGLSVHYTQAGYQVIAALVANSVMGVSVITAGTIV